MGGRPENFCAYAVYAGFGEKSLRWAWPEFASLRELQSTVFLKWRGIVSVNGVVSYRFLFCGCVCSYWKLDRVHDICTSLNIFCCGYSALMRCEVVRLSECGMECWASQVCESRWSRILLENVNLVIWIKSMNIPWWIVASIKDVKLFSGVYYAM